MEALLATVSPIFDNPETPEEIGNEDYRRFESELNAELADETNDGAPETSDDEAQEEVLDDITA